MLIVLFVIIPNIIFILFTQIVGGETVGSDHPIHVNVIDRIKKKNHRFLTDYIISLNEKNVYYPQLFHWVLSFLPEKLYKVRYRLINVIIKLLEIIVFNCFLFYLQVQWHFQDIIFLYSNIVVNAFPFSYAAWNAKNLGLSARGIGLVAGQAYTYLLVIYIINGHWYFYFALLAIVFVIMLLSQMALQFVLLSLCFYPFFFKIPEILLLPILAYGIFYLIMPKLAISYIRGQYNHKRNYALYNAELFLFSYRPSVYRDFIYDFWLKLRKNIFDGLVYIFFNPLVEIIYGLPFLWFVLYSYFNGSSYDYLEVVLLKIVFGAIGVFFLTSFRYTRFLGEPQRYTEFVIPLITILFVLNCGILSLIILVLCCFIFIFLSTYFLNKNKKEKAMNTELQSFLELVEKKRKYFGQVCISNDNELMKFLASLGIIIVRSDTSSYFASKEDYYKLYYNDKLNIHSPFALNDYYNKFNPSLLILNTRFYDLETLSQTVKFSSIRLVEKIKDYELYELTAE